MKKLLSITGCLLIQGLHSANYTVSQPFVPTTPNVSFSTTYLNNNGQIVGNYTTETSSGEFYYYDSVNGLSIISDPTHNYTIKRFSNSGMIVGYQGLSIFTWTYPSTTSWLSIEMPAFTMDVNDLGVIIGYYLSYNETLGMWASRPFQWENSTLTEMGIGSTFAANFNSLGYNLQNMYLCSINNAGQLAGYFSYTMVNQKTGATQVVGVVPFFWDGTIVHIINVAPGYFTGFVGGVQLGFRMELNNNGTIVLTGNSTSFYTWSVADGLQLISGFVPMIPYAMNDSGTILGRDTSGNLAIWSDSLVSTLSALVGSDITNLSAPYNSNYTVEQITGAYTINNQGEIACTGTVWNQNQPCILVPPS